MKSKEKIMDSFCDYNGICSAFLIICIVRGKICTLLNPLETHYTDLLKAPCKQYRMGTDQMGRDIFSRILYGGGTPAFDRICCDSDHFRCGISYRDNRQASGEALLMLF